MGKVKIFTDCASDITVEMAEKRSIQLMPARIHFGDKEFIEGFDCTKEQYTEMLKNSDTIPSTSQYPFYNIEEDFERFYSEGYTHFIVVPISSTASGLYSSLVVAREDFTSRYPSLKIDVIDPKTYSFLYGKYVYAAAKMAEQGSEGDEIVAFLKDKFSRVEAYAGMMELKYSRRSGRISGVAAFVGELLGFKPVLHVMDAKVSVAEKTKGVKNQFARMIELVRQRAADIESQELCIVYGDFSDDELNSLEADIVSALKPKSIIRMRLGPSILSHAGPKTYGIMFEGAKRNQYDI